jgi:cell division protein FtsW (lipid II flippase)
MMRRFAQGMDWVLLGSIVPMLLGGLATMTSFGGTEGFFGKQLLWISVGLVVMIGIAFVDMRFFRDSRYITIFYGISISFLVLVLLLGKTVKGSYPSE